jgi:hypothetical protein
VGWIDAFLRISDGAGDFLLKQQAAKVVLFAMIQPPKLDLIASISVD